jgi:hypothetical protein
MKTPRRTHPKCLARASEIDDPNLLYGRIGYRILLAYRDGSAVPRGPLQGLQSAGTEAGSSSSTHAGGPRQLERLPPDA